MPAVDPQTVLALIAHPDAELRASVDGRPCRFVDVDVEPIDDRRATITLVFTEEGTDDA
jgi:hypothetical protein